MLPNLQTRCAKRQQSNLTNGAEAESMSTSFHIHRNHPTIRPQCNPL
ncbi:hypothetical protein JI435_401660 [Parastagonospora nodorum SN15]|uniref:Uncharacterized protein n=1 Tax=Phaeosphaeria nodorum (strain SN15 / ATCC MYA-4574 / FGSC 10173) TaxID=321614 RepID=A0A7U2EVE8_PHANO|nr:hypothetical protein JI435_401660 [Parastagonospora nodorum SN15]